MSNIDIRAKYPEIFNYLFDYVLIDNGKNLPLIFNIGSQGYCLIEEDYEKIINLMIYERVRLINHLNELNLPDLSINLVPFWNPYLKKFVEIPRNGINDYILNINKLHEEDKNI